MAELHARAQRFTIKTAIRYREVGGTHWFEGTTENISRSGVLFHADHVLELNTALQMRFRLPPSMSADSSGQIHCQGSVMRAAPTDPSLKRG